MKRSRSQLRRFLRPDFDPFLLLRWLTEVEWTTGAKLLYAAAYLAVSEEKKKNSAKDLVIRAACWLKGMECLEWDGARQVSGEQLTEADFKQLEYISVTRAGYELLGAWVPIGSRGG